MAKLTQNMVRNLIQSQYQGQSTVSNEPFNEIYSIDPPEKKIETNIWIQLPNNNCEPMSQNYLVVDNLRHIKLKEVPIINLKLALQKCNFA